MSKMVPNGHKIAKFRKEVELSQEALAREARMCERVLRDVERRNKPIRQTILRNIATALGKPMEELVDKAASKSEEKQDDFDWEDFVKQFPSQLLLTPINDGNRLWSLSYNSAVMSWDLGVNKIEFETAALMEEILKMVTRWINQGVESSLVSDEWDTRKQDEYDSRHTYPDLFRLARLNEILKLLEVKGISLLANRYIHRFKPNEHESDEIREQARLVIAFYPEHVRRKIFRIDPGIPLPTPEADPDDIPF